MTDLEKVKIKYQSALNYISRLTVWQVESWEDSFACLVRAKRVPDDKALFLEILSDLEENLIITNIEKEGRKTDGYYLRSTFHHRYKSNQQLLNGIKQFCTQFQFHQKG